MNILLGEYIHKNSLLNRLDPRTKLIGTFFLMLLLFLGKHFSQYAILGIFVLFLIKLSNIPFLHFLKSIKYLVYLFIFSSLFHIFYNEGGSLLFALGDIKIYSHGVISALEILSKFVLLFIMTSLLTLTTKPMDLVLGLETLGKPLQKIGLPLHDFCFMISLALRFIPLILREIQIIQLAQKARGEDLEPKNPLQKLSQYSSLLVPLLASLIQKVEHMSLAIEARAYHCGEKRTSYRSLSFQKIDLLSFFLLLLLFLLFLLGGK